MAQIELDAAVADFLELGKRMQAQQSLDAKRAFASMMDWYRDTRVTAADLDADGDMLLVEWGVTKPFNVDEPTDLRTLADDQSILAKDECRYLSVTRQLHAGDNPEDFDDVALQLSVTLCYGPPQGDEQNSERWISSPNKLLREMDQVEKVPYVNSLLTVPARRVVIAVNPCG